MERLSARVRRIDVKLSGVRLRASHPLLAVGLLTVATVAVAPFAYASCAERPAESSHSFVGTVIDTRDEDRIATVITDDGERVTVLGTDDTSWFTDSFSSIDRRYAVGARYEFHPTNATDPYRDNACTATHKLAGPALPPLEPADEFLPSWLPVDEQSGPVGYALFAGLVLSGVLGVGVLAWWGRRHWRQSAT